MSGNTNITQRTAGMIVTAVILTVSVVWSFARVSVSIDAMTVAITDLKKQISKIDDRQRDDQRNNDNRLTKLETQMGVNTP